MAKIQKPFVVEINRRFYQYETATVKVMAASKADAIRMAKDLSEEAEFDASCDSGYDSYEYEADGSEK